MINNATKLEADNIDRMTSLLARVGGQKIETVGDCPIYEVSQAWQREVLLDEIGVQKTETPTELEMALEDDLTASVYVPDNTFGMEMLERLLTRHSADVTIFWESINGNND